MRAATSSNLLTWGVARPGLEDMFYLSNVEPKNEGRHLWRSYAARSMFAGQSTSTRSTARAVPVQTCAYHARHASTNFLVWF